MSSTTPPGAGPVTVPQLRDAVAQYRAAAAFITTALNDPERFDLGAVAPDVAADLTIEGKIEGAGHVRIAGKFKGDVKVQGNLTIDQGAKVAGGVTANKVTLAGELDGNIDSAQQVELLQSGVINGDLKAGSLTVAAGSRIRGHIECGWDKDGKSASKTESGNAA